ncbi:MAG: Fic family protein [Chitinophagaceae bacterium]|nr:Fic family protein [Chitinophagaceae bacterium]
MNDNTSWTPFPDDNLLGLTDKNLLNEFEAKGIVKAELYVFALDTEVEISTTLILDIHKTAFEELYDWAGKWRNVNVVVGQLTPPEPAQIIHLMYQFIDNLNFKISVSKTKNEIVDTLIYAHYEFVKIHPFNNGNGRIGRLLMNLVTMKLGYKPLELYKREGESRKTYIQSMQEADKGNFELLDSLIRQELETF